MAARREALLQGTANLDRHVENIRNNFGLPVIVAVNRFGTDTPREIETLVKHMTDQGVQTIMAEHFAKGGAAGATALARAVVEAVDDRETPELKFTYDDGDTLWKKIEKVAKKIYRASEVIADSAVRKKIDGFQADGYGHFPVCIAKTQYSFSTDPKLRGAPSGHVFKVRDAYLSAGAGFMVALCGDIMTMPGLPKRPAADHIDIDAEGQVVGLS